MTKEKDPSENLDPAVEAMSFEEALAQLESIVNDLDRGDLDLQGSIDAYEKGSKLREHCERKLNEAELRVAKITQSAGGAIASTPADFE